MPAVYAFAIILAFFAIGEIVAQKTKAIISTVFVVVVLLMVGFWLGLPPTLLQDSGVTGLMMIVFAATIIGVGSSFDFKTLFKQWKTVIIALLGALSGVLLIWGVGTMIMPYGQYQAFAAGSIFAGTQVAILMFTQAFTENNMPYLIPFLILVFATDNLVGIPVCSFVLRKEAMKFVKDKEKVQQYANVTVEKETPKKRLITIPEAFNKPSGIFCRIMMVAALSWWLAGLTNGRVHFLVVSLILGVVFGELGFLPNDSLPKTQSYLLVVFIVTVVIFGALADTTPSMILGMLVPLGITIGLGFIGVLLGSFILGKILKMSPWMAMGMGVSCSFGMPTTFIIPKEVAAEVGTTEEETKAIENYLIPNMVTAGFVSVTIASVFIAQFAVNFLFA